MGNSQRQLGWSFSVVEKYRLVFQITALISVCFALFAAFLSSPQATALTTVPTKMNFQGRLTDSAGNIKPNGTYNMKLKLYTVSSGGSAVWSEDRLVSASQGVTVTNGLFSIQFGSVTSLPANLFASGELYLEVELPTPASATSSSPVWTEGAMTPRNQMATSAYAYNAETLDGIDSAGFAQIGASNLFTAAQTINVSSTGAFDVQNGSSVSLFKVNTSGSKVIIGTSDTTGTVLVLDTKTDAGDPTGEAGAMYYNSNAGKFRCYQAGAWTDCIGAGGGGGDADTLDTLNSTQFARTDVNNTLTGTQTINVASTGAFDIQNGSSISVFKVDTTNQAVSIGGGPASSARAHIEGHASTAPMTWTARAAAEANTWNSITYGNGLFVTVSTAGTNRVMTSSDGITWTARAASEANPWESVTYGNGQFVAVAFSGTNRVMTSPDGITWTARAAAEASGWQSVTYGNGQFVAVSSIGTNRVMTSPDGITWTARAAAEANSWQHVTYGNGLFVAVSSSGTNRVMTSPDGITWTARAAAEANLWRAVTYGNGQFVAVSSSGTNRVMTSPDGITWTARAATEANSWYSVTYGNGLFVAVSQDGTNRVMASPNGITWTARAAAEANSWYSVTYGNGQFVAASIDGTNRVMTSGDVALSTRGSVRVTGDVSATGELRVGDGFFSINRYGAATLNVLGTNAFDVQNGSAVSVFKVDTSTSTVTIGSASNGTIFSSSGVQFTGSARPTRTVTLAPEYSGATFTGDGTNNTGSLSSDFCSSASLLSVNTSACNAASDEHNYYAWTTTQGIAQDYDIYVRYRIPADYDTGSMTNLSVWAWGSTGASEAVSLELFKGSSTACSSVSDAVTANTTWAESLIASPLGSCTINAGDLVTFKFKLTAGTNNTVRVGELTFNYRSKF